MWDGCEVFVCFFVLHMIQIQMYLFTVLYIFGLFSTTGVMFMVETSSNQVFYFMNCKPHCTDAPPGALKTPAINPAPSTSATTGGFAPIACWWMRGQAKNHTLLGEYCFDPSKLHRPPGPGASRRQTLPSRVPSGSDHHSQKKPSFAGLLAPAA